MPSKKDNNSQIATFAGGCFWCLQPPFDVLPGVQKTIVGYIGSNYPNPTYEQVCSGHTGHTEAIEIHFNSSYISYKTLLDTFWQNINPTQHQRQFADIGSQYRTGIFYHDDEQTKLAEESKMGLERSGKFNDPIVTEIQPATVFYLAEDYHLSLIHI
ncbi:MAG: peptide-methionine (S)-S-oxide reductase MsrA [Alphaproteobacteria bacterium]|nr:peptide-methionine (S)-S-oxide reductase MsrA [Alphaproteobacteria bacterium]